jgi:hypothetical protein
MLSPGAQQLIHDYLNLPCGTMKGIRCPYINNARLRQRGQLRVLVGKGTPREIIEEANIISTQYAFVFLILSSCLSAPTPELLLRSTQPAQ